jgi:hypothetical protein
LKKCNPFAAHVWWLKCDIGGLNSIKNLENSYGDWLHLLIPESLIVWPKGDESSGHIIHFSPCKRDKVVLWSLLGWHSSDVSLLPFYFNFPLKEGKKDLQYNIKEYASLNFYFFYQRIYIYIYIYICTYPLKPEKLIVPNEMELPWEN